jgi:hypothetical protein
MTKQLRAASTTQTHNGNELRLKVEEGEDELKNSQESMMLIDPEEFDSGFTHSQDIPKFPGAKKAPTIAKKVKANGSQELIDKELPAGSPSGGDNISQIPNDTDPSAGYLEKESGLPVINNVSAEFVDDDELDDEEESSEFDDLPHINATVVNEDNVGDEFEDLGTDDEEFSEEPAPVEAEGMAGTPNEEDPEDFAGQSTVDELPLVDVDEVPDTEGSEDLTFAVTASNVLVIRRDRVIASMGPRQAKKIGVQTFYLGDQFHDVTAHAIDTKGLRKGLIQQGFVLARVKVTAIKAISKIVSKKVEAGMAVRREQIEARDKALEHSLAIAAVGINKRYFKDAENPLKAALIVELKSAGVRGASQIVSTAFGEYGVKYAKSILTLANKISAMPEEVRDGHAEALDMTSDEDFDDTPIEVESDTEDEDKFEDLGHGSTVTAALSTPYHRKYPGALLAGVDPSVHDLLFGNKPLV